IWGKAMAQSEWGERFLASTRGRIVSLLRREPRTVNELADALQLTDNAVRAHLQSLERDGLAQQSGTRPGFRKPNFTYELTAAGGQVFAKPYAAILQQLLAVLGERLGNEQVEAIMREVGRRIAANFASKVQSADVAERVNEAVAVLGQLGGLAEIERTDDGLLIRGFDCPLAAAVEGTPAACRLAETLLSELIGAPVVEKCQHGTSHRCLFQAPLA